MSFIRTFALIMTLAMCAGWAAVQEAYVIGDGLRLREAPSQEAGVIARLERGETVTVKERRDGWAHVAAGYSQTGWVAERFIGDAAALNAQPSDSEIRSLLIARSKRGYSGSCPCPNNYDRGGRRCGGRSAYSRPGGASPLCYPSDVSAAAIQAYRNGLR